MDNKQRKFYLGIIQPIIGRALLDTDFAALLAVSLVNLHRKGFHISKQDFLEAISITWDSLDAKSDKNAQIN